MAWEMVALWRLVFRNKQGKEVSSRFLEHQATKCIEVRALDLSLEEAIENHMCAYWAEKTFGKNQHC